MENRSQLVVIAGPNGAGKSTLAEHFIFRKITIINPDVIAKENSLSPLEAGRIAIKQRKEALMTRKPFAIETTLAGSGEIELMKEAKELNYKTNLVYIGVDDVSLSRTRIRIRVAKGGHNVPNEDIARRYERSINNLLKAFKISDRAYILDNSSTKRNLLYFKNGRIEKQVKSILPKWAEKSIEEIKHLNIIGKRGKDIDFGL
jgi:predicted ABC-type ATPase